jgi:hypothetical protein
MVLCTGGCMSEDFVTLKVEGLQEYLDALKPQNAQKASKSALKRMTDMVRTEASATIRQDYAIKKTDLDPFMKYTLKEWRSEISVSGQPISLLYFNAKQLTAQNRIITRKGGRQLQRASRTLGQGVTFQILKGVAKTLPHAFVAYDPRLKRLVVWYRKDKSRGSVRSVNMVTIASLFSSRKTMDAVQKKITDNWPSVFNHELARALSRQGLS